MEENKIYVIDTDENKTYECQNKNDIVKVIIDGYHKDDVCLAELIAFYEIRGLSLEDVVEVYAELFRIVEGDKTIRIINPDNVEYDENDVVEL